MIKRLIAKLKEREWERKILNHEMNFAPNKNIIHYSAKKLNTRNAEILKNNIII